MKQAVGYVRLSKDDENSISTDYQRAEIKKYCKAHDLCLIGMECDNGVSGKSRKLVLRSGVCCQWSMSNRLTLWSFIKVTACPAMASRAYKLRTCSYVNRLNICH